LERWPGRVWQGTVLGLSLVCALAARSIWPTEWFFDDGAIVLRYMDVFAQGGFYQYNLEDPPVYGMSGFIHGILAGGLARSQAMSPQASVLASNTLGVVVTSAALLLIFRVYSSSLMSILLAWLLALVASHYFIVTAFQGLETPLHLGLVLLASWTFLARRSRALWFCCALSVVSKLDAVAVVAVLGLLRILGQRFAPDGRRAWRREARRALVWCGLPLLAWVGSTIVLFGSPFPQSAYAKLMYHDHPASRLAFVQEWWRVDGWLLVVPAAAALALPLVSAVRPPALGGSRLATLGLPLGSAMLLVLYSAYNPAERMPWYYVLPQVLLVVAALVAALDLQARLLRRRLWVGLALGVAVFGALMPVCWRHTLVQARAAILTIRNTEPERAAVGEFVRDHAAPGDRLYTGHGYTARAAGLYTFDYSGLNSPVVTDLRREGKSPIAELRPEWSIRPGLWTAEFQTAQRYELQVSFFGRSCDGRTSWRVFRRRADGDGAVRVAVPVAGGHIATDGKVRSNRDGALQVEGRRTIAFDHRGPHEAAELRVGVARGREPWTVEFWLVGASRPDTLLSRAVVAARDPRDLARGRATELSVAIPPTARDGSEFTVRIGGGDGSTGTILLFEPTWLEIVGQRR